MTANCPDQPFFPEIVSVLHDDNIRAAGFPREKGFVGSVLTLSPARRQEHLAVKLQFFIVIGILIVVILAAGCTEEAPPDLTLPPSDIIQPGQVLMTTGDVTGDGISGGTIDTITFTVGLVPGKGPVDMEKISIYYADTIETETLEPVAGFRGDPPRGKWGIMGVKNEIGAPNNRLEDQEQFVLRINPWAYLPANRMVTIVVRTPTGTPLTLRRIAPPTILKENNILAPL
jgi:archaellin